MGHKDDVLMDCSCLILKSCSVELLRTKFGDNQEIVRRKWLEEDSWKIVSR